MSGRRVILIVEDDANLRRLFRQALIFSGFEVYEAGDGLSALHLVDQGRPDVIALDLGLPVLHDHSVLQELAAHKRTRDIPVVIVTGLSGAHEALGAACVPRKPVSPQRLVEAVRACMVSGSAGAGA